MGARPVDTEQRFARLATLAILLGVGTWTLLIVTNPQFRLNVRLPHLSTAIQAVADGKSTTEVAESLFISEQTVHSHIQSVLTKLGVRSKLEAVLFALREGRIRLPQAP
jgi:hypothetical protein